MKPSITFIGLGVNNLQRSIEFYGKVLGFTLAHNVEWPGAVDATLEEAVAAGAALIKPGQKVFWGGYSGYFAEPDGFYWEVAYNPFI